MRLCHISFDSAMFVLSKQFGRQKKIWCSFSEIKVKGQKTFFTQKFIEYQISIRIPFSLKKDEKLHIWFSLFNFLSKTSDVINK